MNYETLTTPTDYKCGRCGASGVKLWRPYNTVAPSLRCGSCAILESGIGYSVNAIDADGRLHSDTGKSDQIGFYVPAVPTEHLNHYWGYSSVPEAGVRWWRRLPNVNEKSDS